MPHRDNNSQDAQRSPERGVGDVMPRGAFRAFLGVAGVGCVALLLFILAFGLHGEALTAGVDAACAEAAFMNGKNLEARGSYEQAIQQFRQALDGRFRIKEREYLCVRSIGEILFKLGRHAEAIDAFRALPEEAFTAAGSLTAYVSALSRTGDYAEAERLGRIWLANADKARNRQQLLWANATLGQVCLDTGRLDDALGFYRAAETIDPASQPGVMIAKVLERQGKIGEAIEQLDAVLERVKSGQLHEDARHLRAQYQAQRGSNEGAT